MHFGIWKYMWLFLVAFVVVLGGLGCGRGYQIWEGDRMFVDFHVCTSAAVW